MTPNAYTPSNGQNREAGGEVPQARELGTPHPPALARPPRATSTFSIVAVARRDSDLEAFSHNPTDGSFAPLIGRSST